jgi:hypothetical protein
MVAHSTYIVTAGHCNDGKDNKDGKDDDGGGSGIFAQHTTINYMTAAEEMAAVTATATVMETATTTTMARMTARTARTMVRMTTRWQGQQQWQGQ